MALLLAMYQKFRLIREKNELVLKQASYSSKLSRIEKNIERTQKRYTSLFAQLDQQANTFKNNARLQFQNMFGLGSNSVNPYNYSGLNQNSCGTIVSMMSNLGQWYKPKDKNNNPISVDGLSDTQAYEMLAYYMQNGTFAKLTDSEGKATGRYGNDTTNWSEHQVNAFNQAMQQAKAIQNQQQMAVQNMSTMYENNISIWLDAQKAQLEAEQDAALDPLNYEQTMMELSKTQADSRLKRIQAELDSYEQLASQEAEKSAPTFGLR